MSLFGLFGPPDIEKLKAKDDIKGLIKALGYMLAADAELSIYMRTRKARDLVDQHELIRKQAAQALCELGKRPGSQVSGMLISTLNKDLSSPKKDVSSEAAILVLGEISDRSALDVLIAALPNRNYAIRKSAAEALGKIDDPRVIEYLIKALEDGGVRGSAARALARFRDPRAVTPLIKALKDPDGDVRKLVAAALLVSDETEPFPQKTAAESTLVNRLATLWDTKLLDRKSAPRLLAELGDTRALKPLISALDDQEWAAEFHTRNKWQMEGHTYEMLISESRSEIVNALKMLQSPRTVQALIRFLKDPTIAAAVVATLQYLVERLASDIDVKTLRGIASLHDVGGITYSIDSNCGGRHYGYHTKLDCSEIVQLARQELIRRGEQV